MKAQTKTDIKYTAAGLPMLAALLIGSGEPTAECSAATYWTVVGICLAVIIGCAFIIRRIYLSTK